MNSSHEYSTTCKNVAQERERGKPESYSPAPVGVCGWGELKQAQTGWAPNTKSSQGKLTLIRDQIAAALRKSGGGRGCWPAQGAKTPTMPAASCDHHQQQCVRLESRRLRQNLKDVPEAEGVPTAPADSARGRGEDNDGVGDNWAGDNGGTDGKYPTRLCKYGQTQLESSPNVFTLHLATGVIGVELLTSQTCCVD